MLFWLIFNWQNYFVKSLLFKWLHKPKPMTTLYFSIFIVYIFNYYSWRVCLRFCLLLFASRFPAVTAAAAVLIVSSFDFNMAFELHACIASPCLPLHVGHGDVYFFDIICPRRLFLTYFRDGLPTNILDIHVFWVRSYRLPHLLIWCACVRVFILVLNSH